VRFGVQIHVGRGLLRAAEEAQRKGLECVQVFPRNPRGWRAAAHDPEVDDEFRRRLIAYDIQPLFLHTSYLVNLASPDPALRERSRSALAADLRRAGRLGAHSVVVHCGSHVGSGREAGIARVAAALNALLRAKHGPAILLENTAGAGDELAGDFGDLAAILDRVRRPDRAAICLDTCHAHVAGHDLSTARGVGRALDEFDRAVGLSRLALIHANDARAPAGSRWDAHTHIGEGTIGLAGFRALVNDRRLQQLPVILETPLDRPDDDARNLAAIRGLAPGASP
jgi:deoxyribonuclease-4